MRTACEQRRLPFERARKAISSWRLRLVRGQRRFAGGHAPSLRQRKSKRSGTGKRPQARRPTCQIANPPAQTQEASLDLTKFRLGRGKTPFRGRCPMFSECVPRTIVYCTRYPSAWECVVVFASEVGVCCPNVRWIDGTFVIAHMMPASRLLHSLKTFRRRAKQIVYQKVCASAFQNPPFCPVTHSWTLSCLARFCSMLKVEAVLCPLLTLPAL